MNKPTCLIDDCKRKQYRRQWCSPHYNALSNAGKLPPRTGTCTDCGEVFEARKTGRIPPKCYDCVDSRKCVTCTQEIPKRPSPSGKKMVRSFYYCSEECRPRCAVEECQEPVRKRDWCARHYTNWLDHGTPHYEPSYTWSEKWECKTCGNTDKSTWELDARQFCTGRCRVTWKKYDGAVPYSYFCGVCDVEVPYFDPETRKRRRSDSGYCDVHSRETRWIGKCEYTVEDLAAEDGLLCALCGDFVDLNLSYPDSYYPTIDHILPISLGGNHDRENLQLAHSRCNTSKGNRYVG